MSFAERSVLVVSSGEKAAAFLRGALPAPDYAVFSAPDCGTARRMLVASAFDVIMINAPVRDEFGSDFALELISSTISGVVLLIAAELYGDVAARAEEYGVLTVVKPGSRGTLLSAVRLAAAMHSRLMASEQKYHDLEARMKEIRVINRAKWALIKTLGMTEEQAHRYIEKQAMDMRKTKLQVAADIIQTYES